jgi:hypothetical protein
MESGEEMHVAISHSCLVSNIIVATMTQCTGVHVTEKAYVPGLHVFVLFSTKGIPQHTV